MKRRPVKSGGRKRVLCAASVGGHYVQLLRITVPLEACCEVSYMSTHPRCKALVPGHDFYCLRDFSRWNWYLFFPALFHALSVVRRVRPDMVLTTGAAPGFVVVLAAWFLGVESVWVDSIANVESLSLCGKMSRHIATHVFTQWPSQAAPGVIFAGSVLNIEPLATK